MRQQIGLFLHVIDFVDSQDNRRFPSRSLLSTISSSGVQRVPSTTKMTSSTSPIELLAALFIRRLIARFSSMCSRGIHVDGLVSPFGVNTHDAVTRGLRFTRGNGNLLPEQIIQQRGFTHVGGPTMAINPQYVFQFQCSFQLQFFQRLFGCGLLCLTAA
jgi:hypothetical protein